MNTVFLVIAGLFLLALIFTLLCPILALLSFIAMIVGFFSGNGGLAIAGLLGSCVFGAMNLWVQSKPVYVVNKR